MKKKISGNEIVMASILVIVGALFMIFKGEIISIIMTILGIRMIVRGIFDLMRGYTMVGVVNIVFGALILGAGWLFITLALYILAACLLIAGIGELSGLLKERVKKLNLAVILRIAQPVIYILVAICLFFNQGGAISWVFTVAGLFLIVDGILGLIAALDKR